MYKITQKEILGMLNCGNLVISCTKKGQATHIAPLQPLTLAMFPSWGIQQELVV